MRIGGGHVIGLLILALALATFDNLRLVSVAGDSDAPKYVTGDKVLVNRAAYDLRLPFTPTILTRLGHPKVGDVVLLTLPDGSPALKRVVAVGGKRVALDDNHLVIDGQPLDYRLVADNERPAVQRGRMGAMIELERGNGPDVVVSYTPGGESVGLAEQEVPPGTYFVLGSNRDVSVDSRSFGPIPRDRILGKAMTRLWSAGR